MKILRNHEAQFPKFSVFIGQKSIFYRNCIQNFNDGIQIQVYNVNNENVNHFIQLISVKIKKISCSILGNVKKLEAWAKWRFSYKKGTCIDFAA